jgi:hypothetical protein
LTSNLVFARNLLPNSDFALCEFESAFAAKTIRGAAFDNAMWVDHVQHSGFARSTMMQFHNARVAGACMRMTFPNAGTGLKRGLRYLIVDRIQSAAEAIRTHPYGRDLPVFTYWRLRWLSAAIAVGYIYGSCFGFGRSPWRLE